MDFNPMGLAIRSQLQQVGIDAVIVVVNVGEYYQQIFDPRCESLMWVQPDGASYVTEPGWVWDYGLQSNLGTSYFGWNVTSQDGFATYFETQFRAINALPDQNQRIQEWIQLDRYMLKYGWATTLTTSMVRAAFSSSITGFFAPLEFLYPAIFYMDKTTSSGPGTTSAPGTTSGAIAPQFLSVNYVTQRQMTQKMPSWMQLDHVKLHST
jgi:ABC-type transport system substrate-binding protein